MLTNFLKKRPIYEVETGYGFSDRFSFTYESATEALNATYGEWVRAIWRGNQRISYEQLVQDARQESAARTAQ